LNCVKSIERAFVQPQTHELHLQTHRDTGDIYYLSSQDKLIKSHFDLQTCSYIAESAKRAGSWSSGAGISRDELKQEIGL
jgi:hypothetical protein